MTWSGLLRLTTNHVSVLQAEASGPPSETYNGNSIGSEEETSSDSDISGTEKGYLVGSVELSFVSSTRQPSWTLNPPQVHAPQKAVCTSHLRLLWACRSLSQESRCCSKVAVLLWLDHQICGCQSLTCPICPFLLCEKEKLCSISNSQLDSASPD